MDTDIKTSIVTDGLTGVAIQEVVDGYASGGFLARLLFDTLRRVSATNDFVVDTLRYVYTSVFGIARDWYSWYLNKDSWLTHDENSDAYEEVKVAEGVWEEDLPVTGTAIVEDGLTDLGFASEEITSLIEVGVGDQSWDTGSSGSTGWEEVGHG